jgi:hypothetical protein
MSWVCRPPLVLKCAFHLCYFRSISNHPDHAYSIKIYNCQTLQDRCKELLLKQETFKWFIFIMLLSNVELRKIYILRKSLESNNSGLPEAYILCCPFQRVSTLLLSVVQQYVCLLGQSGSTSQGMSSRSGVELWCLWPTEIPPWPGACQLPCRRQSCWLWGVWSGFQYHHAAIPALPCSWHSPLYALQGTSG